ncbi:hypothetical protein Avbf_14240 [Armadillidium vulgare]|nr:hypothetical protein Avbf_14240 [Armadillidium vulgare]
MDHFLTEMQTRRGIRREHYFIGETGELECNYGYQYLSGKMKQNVTCEVGGWNISHLEECYEINFSLKF